MTADAFTWERRGPDDYRHWPAVLGEPETERVLLRCSPVWWLVLDVTIEPSEERGAWSARWRYQVAAPEHRGRADSIEEAKESALDAAERLLADALKQLEARRSAPRAQTAAPEAE